MEIEFYRTIMKTKKPKNNRERGFLGVVEETDKYYVLACKNSSQYSMSPSRSRYLKATFEDKFSRE